MRQRKKPWALSCRSWQSFFGFLPPLIIWLIYRERSALLDAQGRYALNWTFSFLIYAIVAWVLTFVLIGFLMYFALIIINLVVCIIAAVKANERIAWQYPLAIPFFKVEAPR
ncbi:MAG: DUF4870 domain-containing protein [Micrococcaceae bacterium]|uniref:DUF4870 domain-containing protein n=1 Tax=Yaniella flava TaxID=287930 RepID=UPI0017ABA824|nr:DUF4870 domain-containing protein [Micrococcaceae bacterium]